MLNSFSSCLPTWRPFRVGQAHTVPVSRFAGRTTCEGLTRPQRLSGDDIFEIACTSGGALLPYITSRCSLICPKKQTSSRPWLHKPSTDSSGGRFAGHLSVTVTLSREAGRYARVTVTFLGKPITTLRLTDGQCALGRVKGMQSTPDVHENQPQEHSFTKR